MGFTCRDCGEEHDQLPMSFHAEMPQAWMEIPEDEEEERGQLSSDQCEIDGEHFFMRGLVKIPVQGLEETLDWGVWFELSPEIYDRFVELWDDEGRDQEPPHPARLSTRLPSFLYPDTIDLPVRIFTQAVGERPLVQVGGDHPLAVEQKQGMTQARLEEIWAKLLHQDDDEDEDDA